MSFLPFSTWGRSRKTFSQHADFSVRTTRQVTTMASSSAGTQEARFASLFRVDVADSAKRESGSGNHSGLFRCKSWSSPARALCTLAKAFLRSEPVLSAVLTKWTRFASREGHRSWSRALAGRSATGESRRAPSRALWPSPRRDNAARDSRSPGVAGPCVDHAGTRPDPRDADPDGARRVRGRQGRDGRHRRQHPVAWSIRTF